MTVFEKNVSNLFCNISLREFKAAIDTVDNKLGSPSDLRIWVMTDQPLRYSPLDTGDPETDKFLRTENEKRTKHLLTSTADLTEAIWSDPSIKFVQAELRAKQDGKAKLGTVRTTKNKKMSLKVT